MAVVKVECDPSSQKMGQYSEISANISTLDMAYERQSGCAPAIGNCLDYEGADIKTEVIAVYTYVE